MTETNATPPVDGFPPGRYGRRREPGRGTRWARVAMLAALLLAVVAVGTVSAVVFTRQYGPGRDYHPTVERFYDVTDSQVVVEFTVRVPAAQTAVCAVRARAGHGGEVGREEIRVTPDPEAARTRVVHRLATTQRPVTGEVQRCWRAPAR
ncbi:MAG: DUF4307 domain-containing protein [Micromonosporaceae bacterium]|nr:DUF4307 domain-containing protein [Micromonosporaceae bacterium]